MQHYSTIKINSEGHLAIVGELTFITAKQLYERGCQLIEASPLPIFDCQQINLSDNSSLAIFLAWIRYGKHLHKNVTFINLTSQISAIIKIANLDNIFNKKTDKTEKNYG